MKFRFLFFWVLLCFSIPTISLAQIPGCPDPLATNYSATATINDGSCVYSVTNYSPVFIGNLGSSLNESSGLGFFNGQLWSHNDSGNPNEIYQVNPANGTVMRRVVIENAVNTDWESITQNDEYLFVGDFGNNSGNRTNLKILRISIDDIANAVNDSVEAEIIQFGYADQTSFVPATNNNNYDCEAFFYSNDSLHLFTKNWANLKTKHYVLPAVPGTYEVVLTDSFNVDGLITDAAINDSGNIVLLGYKNNGNNLYTCFAWLMYDYPNYFHCFGGNKRRIELGTAFTLGQTEGITLFDDNSGYISSEQIVAGILNLPPKLHSFTFDQYVSDVITKVISVNVPESEVSVYPNRFSEMLMINNNSISVSTDYKLINASGKVVLKGSLLPGLTTLNTEKLAEGLYFFKVRNYSVKLLK